MPGRKYTAGSSYRYGFKGKENDNDVKNVEGGQQDYGMRIYDPRVGKFLSMDPLTKEYPHYTPYSFAGNKPIRYNDRDGEEESDLDRYYDRAIPVIKQNFAKNLLAFSNVQQADLKKSIDYAFTKRETFKNGLRWLSARLLTRWMEGKGGYDILSYNAVNSIQVNGNIRRVRQELIRKVNDYAETLSKPGTYSFTAFSNSDRSGADAQIMLNDVGSSLGSYKILGAGSAYININKNGEKLIIMDLDYTLAEKYQWKEGTGINDGPFVDHNIMLKLEKIGAKPFYIRGYFHQGYRSENGKESITEIKNSTNHENHPEPRPFSDGSPGYNIPSSENQKENDN